jgi:predicted alpha/beta superfamily hydrolase
MTSRMLSLVLVLGCTTARGSAPVPADSTAAEPAADEAVSACQRGAIVTVHVENGSSFDMEISFGGYKTDRAVAGFSHTTYRVPRYYLQSPIQLWIARGGLEVNVPSPVKTEPVFCNDATLIIGPRPIYSYFYGDLVGVPPRDTAPAGEPPRQEPAAECCTVTIRVHVPDGTDTVYLAGSLPELGPWRPDGRAMTGEGRERTTQVTAPPGTTFEYKFTLGSWDREALGPDGKVPPNNRVLVDDDVEATHEIADFKDPRRYIADWKGSGVEGRLVYWTDVRSAFLGPTRHVEIWLPPGYDGAPSTRYPVLYMADGQNLFDPRIANTGVDWGVDEAVVRLAKRGVITPVIVVGVWSTGDRGPEYSPWHRAPDYARFLIDELMPRVNAEFRTLTGPAHTAVMGSSMGGLLSFYLVTHHPDVFGACGCVSTHFPLSEAMVAASFPGAVAAAHPDTTPYIIRDIAAGLRVPKGTRYWFDYGTVGLDSTYGPTHAAVRAWLLTQGLVEGRDFVVPRYEGATHNEASWRARLDDPLTFLFGRKGP